MLAFALLWAQLAISIHTDFEGGSLGRVQPVSATHFRLSLAGEADQDGRNRQANWYYFSVDGAKDRDIVLDLVNLPGEYNYQPNRGAVTADTVPVFSDDNEHWQHFASTEYDSSEPRLRLRARPKGNRFWVAHVPPYTNAHLKRLLDEFRSSPYLTQEAAGKSVEGRDIPLLTITAPTTGPKKVLWLMFRQHSWETGSSWAGEGAIRFLLGPDAEARRIRERAIVKIFPLCDPDGVARGGVRFNKFGFDLNRNWDVVDPKRTPEITGQRKAVLDWIDSGHAIDLFLSLHNTETAEYVDGPPDLEGKTAALRQRVYDGLLTITTFAPSRPPRADEVSTTPGKPGRMNVAQGLYRDRKVNAFLMEQRISRNPKLGRLPRIEDRIAFGATLVRALFEALSGS